jgi:hypothetical protein
MTFVDWSFFVDDGGRRGLNGFQKLAKISAREICPKKDCFTLISSQQW